MEETLIIKGPEPKEPVYPKSIGIRTFEALESFAKTNKIAFINITTDTNLSYKHLFEESVKVAIYLKKQGYAGKVIGIYSENRSEYFIPLLAGLYIGSPVVPLNHGYSQREFKYACEFTKPTLIFCSDKTYKTLIKIRIEDPLEYIQHICMIEDIPKLSTGITDNEISTFHPVDLDPKEDIAILFFSSGTTGLPKAVAITHHNMSFIHRLFYDENYVFSAFTNYINCLPLYHVYAFTISVVTILKGLTIKFLDKFDPVIFLEAIEKYKVEHLPLVPPLMTFLAKHPLVDKYDVSSVKVISSGAASCSKELENAVLKRFPLVPGIHQIYGLTESSFALVTTPVNCKPREGSVGTVDIGVELKVRNSNTNQVLGVNEVGEICLRSESVMKGYYACSEANKYALTQDGWLLTGDLGFYDEEGNVFVVDRVKELIKFKGFQVAPAELEGLLLSHPNVMDAAVVGYPDESAGELPMAFIVKKSEGGVGRHEIQEFIKKLVSYPKQLHGGVRFVESIPKSPSGKILRRVLRDLLEKEKKNVSNLR